MSNVIIFSDSSNYNSNTISIPIRMAGPFRLATELRQHGYSCQLIDFLFSFSQEEIQTLCSKFISTSTRIIAFSTTFWFIENNQYINNHALNNIGTIIKYVRERHPTVKVVIGGYQTHKIKNLFKFDAEFIGYSDSLFLKYLKDEVNGNLTTNTDSIVYTFNQHEETFNFASSSVIYHQTDLIDYNSTVSIEISRGCIFKCKFCAFPLNGKKKLDYIKDTTVLREEFIRNYEDFKITNYIISDDTFNDSTIKLKHLHDVLKSLPFKISFTAYLRLDLLYFNQEQISLLKEMGLIAANFGIESFNHKTSKSIGKGMNPDIIKQFLFDLKTKHWGPDINITVGLIIGLPHETLDNIYKTIEWINNKDYCLIDSITIKALGIRNNQTLLWQSEFEKNKEKYGYEFPNNDSNWINTNCEISSHVLAQKLEMKVNEECNKNNISSLNNNFVLFILNNLIRYADKSFSFEDYCKLSNYEKAKWRKENLKTCVSKYIENYKIKLFNLIV